MLLGSLESTTCDSEGDRRSIQSKKSFFNVDAVNQDGMVTSMLPESKCELMTSLHAVLDSSILSVLAALVGAALPSSHLR